MKGASMMSWASLALAVFIMYTMAPSLTMGFECYTGDGAIMRRKDCANNADICFKKIPDRKFFHENNLAFSKE